ncbi:hypothetical protein PENSPDRAFT_646553 [Peniophora sp. CONT]|nr:hypothetical protein PENSPDRAFT_646553 [Peniophora sp. CONT]
MSRYVQSRYSEWVLLTRECSLECRKDREDADGRKKEYEERQILRMEDLALVSHGPAACRAVLHMYLSRHIELSIW